MEEKVKGSCRAFSHMALLLMGQHRNTCLQQHFSKTVRWPLSSSAEAGLLHPASLTQHPLRVAAPQCQGSLSPTWGPSIPSNRNRYSSCSVSISTLPELLNEARLHAVLA